ncbi:MAG: hypothetical protein PUF50_08525 [Erysipelotrichaceae bacterium]|nr:hypothetical protein [Erysipelotrichaceae bacterium]
MEIVLVIVLCLNLFFIGLLIGSRKQYAEDMREFLNDRKHDDMQVLDTSEKKDEIDQLNELLDYQYKGRNRK